MEKEQIKEIIIKYAVDSVYPFADIAANEIISLNNKTIDAKHFTIKQFESKHPDIVELIEKWERISIMQKDWNVFKMVLNSHNVACPEDVWDETIMKNKRWAFFEQLLDEMVKYFSAKGFKYIKSSRGISTLEYVNEFNNKGWFSGYVFEASMSVPEKYKHL